MNEKPWIDRTRPDRSSGSTAAGARTASPRTRGLVFALGMLGMLGMLGALGLAACGGSGMGADTRADITARMTSVQQPLQACYASALKGNHRLRGMMVLSFVAAPETGQFQEILVTRDELNDPGVRKCVLDEVARLKLEKPQASRVSISYPIRFEPNN